MSDKLPWRNEMWERKRYVSYCLPEKVLVISDDAELIGVKTHSGEELKFSREKFLNNFQLCHHYVS
jgi:hypothetical protein